MSNEINKVNENNGTNQTSSIKRTADLSQIKAVIDILVYNYAQLGDRTEEDVKNFQDNYDFTFEQYKNDFQHRINPDDINSYSLIRDMSFDAFKKVYKSPLKDDGKTLLDIVDQLNNFHDAVNAGFARFEHFFPEVEKYKGAQKLMVKHFFLYQFIENELIILDDNGPVNTKESVLFGYLMQYNDISHEISEAIRKRDIFNIKHYDKSDFETFKSFMKRFNLLLGFGPKKSLNKSTFKVFKYMLHKFENKIDEVL